MMLTNVRSEKDLDSYLLQIGINAGPLPLENP